MTLFKVLPLGRVGVCVACGLTLLYGGCVSKQPVEFEEVAIEQPHLHKLNKKDESKEIRYEGVSPANSDITGDDAKQTQGRTFSVPGIRAGEFNEGSAGNLEALPQLPDGLLEIAVPELSLPQFIDFTFGEMLKVPYTIGEGVASKRDQIVQLRSSGELAADDFFNLVREALKEYGVAVDYEGGVYKVVDDDVLNSKVPHFIKSRAKLSTPASLRPYVMFVELKAMSANGMTAILKQAFPGNNVLKISANPKINVITLTGLPEDINSALNIIDNMDELTYAGTQLYKYPPVFWGAKELGAELNKMLSSEGWQSSNNASAPRSILILPVETSNDLFVFSKSAEALARARFWLSQLDQPSKQGDVAQIFIYDVQNVDADLLASTVNAVLSGGLTESKVQNVSVGAAQELSARETNKKSAGGLIVDKISNRLIYSGSASDYNRLLPLLQQLDKRPGEVLIQVTIAEVTLKDDTNFGVEFFINNIGNSDFNATVGDKGLISNTGLNVGFLSGNVDLAINAFASNNEIKVLSRPHLVARSGGAARIQVGTDVPVISSQRAASSQDGVGETDILQTVEYRSTGVLLAIEPIIFSQDRVDLNVAQEVSTVLEGAAAAISSPSISNRTIETQLSLLDGQTAVLGGLIQETTTEGNTGVPLLKDIPIVGPVFKNNKLSEGRTELIVLITAYILNNREDRAEQTDKWVRRLNDIARSPDNLDTLTSPEIDTGIFSKVFDEIANNNENAPIN